jgi:isopentenyldiphosphate isomerase
VTAAGELVEVLAGDGSVRGVVTRAEMRAGRLRHRCTFVVVRSSAGEVLVHRRSDHKDLWPGRWDLCAGGVVTAGEGWAPAARRELAEELGIEPGPGGLRPLGEFSYADDDVDELCRVWTTTHDGPFSFDDGEVAEARFVGPDELRAMLATEAFTPDSAAVVAPLVVGTGAEGGAD